MKKSIVFLWVSIAASCSLTLSACGSPSSAPDRATPSANSTALTSGGIVPPPAPVAAPVDRYTPNFDEREGDTYFYATAVSEEDKKKGKSVGNVVGFRYLGQKDGKHRVASVDDDGRVFAVSECAISCRIIKRTYRGEMERIPYDTQSVIGAAFEDAIHGSLKVARGADQIEQVQPDSTAIPAAFLGEWNDDLAACGTGLSDSRLRIEPKRVRFYESDGEVRRVTILNQRAIKVAASFAGEGQVWTDEVQFVLSRSGDDLASGDVTRRRCPAAGAG